MTAPLPPTSGPVGPGTPEEKMAGQDTGSPMGIVADHPDLGAMAAAAQAQAQAWTRDIAPLMDSPAGYGADGFTIAPPVAAGDGGSEWDSNVGFPHQGP